VGLEPERPQVERRLAMYTRKWTKQELEVLLALANDGKSDKEIAEELLRTPMAVKIKRTRAGVLNRAMWTEEEDLVLGENAELSSRDIAALLSRWDAQSVDNRRSVLGIPRPGGRWTEGDEQLLRDNLHLTDRDLGIMVGRSGHTVAEKRRRMGLPKRN